MMALKISTLQLYLMKVYFEGRISACFQSYSVKRIKSVMLFYSTTISDSFLDGLFSRENLARAKE